MKRILTIAVLILIVAGAPVYAAEVTTALDLNSAYVWRGMTFNNGFVAQPSVDITQGGLDLNVWGNMDISDYNEQKAAGNFQEVDLTLSYGFSISKLDIGFGVIEYLFPDSSGSTREVYTSVGINIIAGLSAGVDLYYDVDEFHGLYTSLKVAYAYNINDKLGIEASAAAGYTSHYNDVDAPAGFHDYIISLTGSYGITDALSVNAGLHYVGSLDDNVLAEGSAPGTLDTKFYGGVGVSYTF